MIKAALPYLNFAGDAGDAIAYYQKVLGAELVTAMKWKDLPGEGTSPALADKIMHAELKIGAATVMLCDLPPEMQATSGGPITVMLQCSEPSDVDRFFAGLAEGGKVMMAVDDTFWGARYGFCIDRYGIGWQLNCQLEG